MKAWLSAFRLRTLPLALACVFVAGGLTYDIDSFDWLVFGLIVATTMFLQILSNLANDYGDTQNGADNEEREGPSRAVQTGAISMGAMKVAMGIFVLLSLTSGVSLLFTVFGIGNWPYLLGFFVMGLLAIWAAIKYTAGQNPYGYAGLGDISVFLFFGIIGVVGAAYLLGGTFEILYVLPATAIGAFSTGVLNLNNMRDIKSDEIAGKRSIPVRIGLSKAKRYHSGLIVVGMLSVVSYAVFSDTWYYLAVLPLFVLNLVKTLKAEGSELDSLLKPLALSTFFFAVFFFATSLY